MGKIVRWEVGLKDESVEKHGKFKFNSQPDFIDSLKPRRSLHHSNHCIQIFSLLQLPKFHETNAIGHR
jgi:hypothetical protein